MQIKPWISAFRLRTLPLALSVIAMGSFLAAAHGQFRWSVWWLAALTTLLLQILSNLANDYGDSIHGADKGDRKGPSRAVQSGQITPSTMKRAMIVTALLSFVSGLALLWVALGAELKLLLIFLGLGILCILAAIGYTNGKRPYGYAGLGDISVLIFFGLIGVGGSYFLHTQTIDWAVVLPALSVGFFSVGVLNVNNIRDIESDKAAGKYSIPVRIGRPKAVIYHWLLLTAGLFCGAMYVLQNAGGYTSWLFLVSLPLFWKVGRGVQTIDDPMKLDPFLKMMALSTMLFVITFGIGILI
jgi:1,4-dihydroxy-2-naphthoate polyprenyltransferase